MSSSLLIAATHIRVPEDMNNCYISLDGFGFIIMYMVCMGSSVSHSTVVLCI